MKSCPDDQSLYTAISMYKSTRKIPLEVQKKDGYASCDIYNYWWLLSCLTPYISFRQKATGNAIWKLALSMFHTYKKNKFMINVCMSLLSVVFPSIQSHWFVDKLLYSQRILDIILKKDIKGITSFFQSIKANYLPALSESKSEKFVTKVIKSDLLDPEYRELVKDCIHYYDPKNSDILASKTERTQIIDKKSYYYGKHSTVLTKHLNFSIKYLNQKLENILLSNPFVNENAYLVPISLCILHLTRKSVVIDKYETFVRSFNNMLRRSLGEKIKPTKNDPLQLLISGKIKPVIRRDLLFSNVLLIFATFQKQILEFIRDEI